MSGLNAEEMKEFEEELDRWDTFSKSHNDAFVETVILHSEDWNEIKSHILLAGERNIYSPAFLFRLAELALEHRDDDPQIENEQKVTNAQAVLNAVCTVGCRVPRQHMFLLWPFLEPGHRIDTCREVMRRLYRFMEAQPAKKPDEYFFLVEQLAHVAIDNIVSGKILAHAPEPKTSEVTINHVFAITAVEALCASGCSNALAHIQRVLELPQIWDQAPYFPFLDIKEMRDEWVSLIQNGDKRAPCQEAVNNLNDCIEWLNGINCLRKKKNEK